MAGSSEMEFSEPGTANTVPSMVEAYLRARRPEIDWRVQGAIVYQLPTMPERVQRLIERHRPDAVFLWLSGNVYAESTVTWAVLHRFRRLYGPASRLAEAALRGAGGGSEGSESLRGLIFRLPRAALRTAFGQSPLVQPEVAASRTEETLAALREREGLMLLCRLSYSNSRQRDQAESVRRTVDWYNARIAVRCQELGIPYFVPEREARERGFEYGMGPDGLHATFETRRWSAEVATDLLLSSLDGGALSRRGG